jgi:multicomponent K+:H+ antiporter subunit D
MACALLIAGLPPLPTFLGKAAMLSAAIAPAARSGPGGTRAAIFAGVILCSGLLALIALVRSGIRTFWSGGGRPSGSVRAVEAVPVVALLGLCGLLTVGAGPIMALADTAARSLHGRREYIDAVLRANATTAVPPKGLPAKNPGGAR